MGGLKPLVRSALAKLPGTTMGATPGKATASPDRAGYPVTKAIQSWQVVQPLHKIDTALPPFSDRSLLTAAENGQSSGIAN